MTSRLSSLRHSSLQTRRTPRGFPMASPEVQPSRGAPAASPYTRTPMPEIAAPRGTRDILPDEFAARRWLLDAHRTVAESFGYRAIETPIIEATELFSRGVGTDTDIVEKQMFTFGRTAPGRTATSVHAGRHRVHR